jgi:hypothetical protein
MLFGKDEADVKSLFKEHVAKVHQSLEILQDVMKAYIEDAPTLREKSYLLHKTEHEADVIRRQIQHAIAAGAFLPFYREDYISLSDFIDKVANRAVDLSKSVVLEKPLLPEAMKPNVLALAASVLTTFLPFDRIVELLFEDPAKALELTEKVSEGEQEGDSIEWKTLNHIFSDTSLPRVEQIISERMIQRISAISDAIENAADKVRIVAAKQNA